MLSHTNVFITCAILVTAALGAPSQTHRIEDRDLTSRPVIIKSLSNNTKVGVRYEVRDLKVGDPVVWDLLLQGLKAIKEMNQSDPLSYFQIAGKKNFESSEMIFTKVYRHTWPTLLAI